MAPGPIVAVVALALNLRPSVNAMGALIPEVREALGLSATAAGALTSLPPLCFALIGLLAPSLPPAGVPNACWRSRWW